MQALATHISSVSRRLPSKGEPRTVTGSNAIVKGQRANEAVVVEVYNKALQVLSSQDLRIVDNKLTVGCLESWICSRVIDARLLSGLKPIQQQLIAHAVGKRLVRSGATLKSMKRATSRARVELVRGRGYLALRLTEAGEAYLRSISTEVSPETGSSKTKTMGENA